MGLFVDLLAHKVGVAALLCRADIPVRMACLTGKRLPVLGEKPGPFRRHHCDFVFLHQQVIPGIGENRRHVRGNKIFPLAKTHYQRAVLAHRVQGTGMVRKEDSQGVRAPQNLQSPAYCRHGVGGFAVFLVQPLGDDLRVGLGGKYPPLV